MAGCGCRAAEELTGKAKERMAAKTAQLRAAMAKGQEVLGAEAARRREAVLGLKASVDAVQVRGFT